MTKIAKNSKELCINYQMQALHFVLCTILEILLVCIHETLMERTKTNAFILFAIIIASEQSDNFQCPYQGRSRDGIVVIALAFHLCGLGSGLELVKLVVGSLLSSERFFSGFPLSSKINISKFQFDRMQDIPENHFRVSRASWVNIINYYY